MQCGKVGSLSEQTGISVTSRLAGVSAWASLVWLMVIGLVHFVTPLGALAPGFAAPELSAPVLLGLGLPALAVLWLRRAPLASRQAAQACMGVAALLLFKLGAELELADLLRNRVVDGVSVVGRCALGAWLLVAGLVCWALGLATARGLTVALLGCAGMSLAVGAASMFALTCWLTFGAWPGSASLVSMPLLAAVILLTLALILAAQRQLLLRSQASPEEGYRWLFARKLGLLLGTSVFAGLVMAAVASHHAGIMLMDGLLSRSERHAGALVHQVEHLAASVKALHARAAQQAPHLDLDAVARALSHLAGEDGQHGLKHDKLMCMQGTEDQLYCADLAWPLTAGNRAQLAHFTLHASEWRGVRGRLVEVSGPSTGRVLAALSPLGDQGAYLMLKVSAASLFRAVGKPMLLAMLLLAVLATVAATVSYRRQRQATRSLLFARAQADATMLHLPLATLVVDEQLRVLQVNPAAETLLGAGAVTLLGQPIGLILPDWHVPEGDADRAAQSRQHMLTARGEEVPVDVTVSSLTSLGQRRHLLMLRDVSAELRELRNLRRWERVFECSGWGMVISSVGDEPIRQRVNLAYAQMLGYRPSELAGKPSRGNLVASYWDAFMQLRQAAEQGRSMQAEMRHRHRDGREIPTLVSLAAVRDDQGKVSHFVVSVQDISALKRAEQEATSHARHLRAVLDALPVGVWIGDAQGVVQQTNRAAQRLWTGRDGVGDPQWWGRQEAMPIDHDSLMRRAAVLRDSVDSGLVEVDIQGGSRRALLSTASPMLDEHGVVMGAIAIDEDVTTLRDSEAAVRRSKDMLERILEACTVGVALINEQGVVLQSNLAWHLLLGPIEDCEALRAALEAEDALTQGGLVERVARGEVPAYVGEHRMRRASGAMGWTLVVVSRLDGAPGEDAGVLVQVLDIDARRRIAEEMAGNHLRLAAAQRLARMGDWQWDVGSDVVSCSEQTLRILGHEGQSRGEIKGERIRSLVHRDDQARLIAASDRALLSLGILAQDIRLIRPDGVELTVHVHGVVQRTPAGLMMSGTLQDITDRKEIESELRESRERLRELVAHEGELIEEERKRIAREVHDELGQLLTALRMDLSMLRAQIPAETAAAARADQMRETMATMTDVVRHVASNLRPAALDMGLTAAIEWLAEDFSLRWEMQCDVQLSRDHEPDLPESASLALFRAVQESLTNIAKHAQATKVSISLMETAGVLHLRVSDDGRGFDLAAVVARRGGGLGLLGMRERMHTIGAQFDIQSGSAGTTLTINYPISGKASHETH